MRISLSREMCLILSHLMVLWKTFEPNSGRKLSKLWKPRKRNLLVPQPNIWQAAWSLIPSHTRWCNTRMVFCALRLSESLWTSTKWTCLYKFSNRKCPLALASPRQETSSREKLESIIQIRASLYSLSCLRFSNIRALDPTVSVHKFKILTVWLARPNHLMSKGICIH